jgi:hypothetical protein
VPRFFNPSILTRERISSNIFKYKYYILGHYPSSCLYLKCHPVYFLKHNISETGFCLHFQVRPTQLGPSIELVLYFCCDHKTGLVRDAQQTKQHVYSISYDYGRCYISEIRRPLEVSIKEDKYNLTQGLLEK